jgi:hypothetical protein
MSRGVCSCCGQPLPELCAGVRLPKLKTRIFNLVKRGGEDGIDRRDLCEILYGEASVAHLQTLKAHLYQINEELTLEDAGCQISGRTSVRIVRCDRYD